jgi:hypothetical protein
LLQLVNFLKFGNISRVLWRAAKKAIARTDLDFTYFDSPVNGALSTCNVDSITRSHEKQFSVSLRVPAAKRPAEGMVGQEFRLSSSKKLPLDGISPVCVPMLQPWPASKVIVRCDGDIQTKKMFEFTKATLHGEVGNIPVLCFC